MLAHVLPLFSPDQGYKPDRYDLLTHVRLYMYDFHSTVAKMIADHEHMWTCVMRVYLERYQKGAAIENTCYSNESCNIQVNDQMQYMYPKKKSEKCSHTKDMAMLRNLRQALQLQLDESAHEHNKGKVFTDLLPKC